MKINTFLYIALKICIMKIVYLISILALFNFSVFAQPTPAAKPVSGEDICKAVLTFLTDIKESQLQSYIGERTFKNDGLSPSEYTSLQKFPLAMKTTIIDTGVLLHYRSAKVLMVEETVATETISPKMKDYFDQLNKLFAGCLVPNHFEYESSVRFSFYKFETSFSFKIPSTGAFGNMRAGNSLKANVYIDQKKNNNGTFTNQLYIYLRRV